MSCNSYVHELSTPNCWIVRGLTLQPQVCRWYLLVLHLILHLVVGMAVFLTCSLTVMKTQAVQALWHAMGTGKMVMKLIPNITYFKFKYEMETDTLLH